MHWAVTFSLADHVIVTSPPERDGALTNDNVGGVTSSVKNSKLLMN